MSVPFRFIILADFEYLSRKMSLMTGRNMFLIGGLFKGFSWGIYYLALAIYDRI